MSGCGTSRPYKAQRPYDQSGPIRPFGGFIRRWLLVVICFALTGCSFRVSVAAVDDSNFRAVWESGWAAVDDAAKPLNPTATNPGVCNQGGSKLDCLQTGEAMIPALQSLAAGLVGVETPASYRSASQQIQAAIAQDVQAITDRNTAIRTTDQTLFTKAIGELQQAAQDFNSGYRAFPEATRPTPVPFDGGLVG